MKKLLPLLLAGACTLTLAEPAFQNVPDVVVDRRELEQQLWIVRCDGLRPQQHLLRPARSTSMSPTLVTSRTWP